MISNQPILIVEDSDEDFEVTVWALRKAGVERPVLRATRAREGYELIQGQADARDPASPRLPAPCLVLLDLNLPGADGRELLTLMRSGENPSAIPVVVLSTSDNPRDIEACYRLGASGYVCKPMKLDLFAQRIRDLVAYWFGAVHLPGMVS